MATKPEMNTVHMDEAGVISASVDSSKWTECCGNSLHSCHPKVASIVDTFLASFMIPSSKR